VHAGRLAVLVGMFDIAANGLYLLAVQRGLLSVVVVVVALYPVGTVSLALTLDGERVTKTQVFGMSLAAVALVLISSSG
jgi:drug/metabolite transporter (DMT)-like permease